MVPYKAQLVGIEVTTQEESYTSKCSALGLLINADVNGALNILRKVIGDTFLKPFIEKVARLIPSSGYLCYPIKVCF